MSRFPAEAAPREPLAVIGLSCLFPKAANVAEFWSNVRRGVDAITEIPPTHWNPDDYFDADPKSPDMTYARRGGFLLPVAFDPLEFGIAPSNLEAIDTSQLLGLVGAKRALDDAGYGADRQFDRSRIGCILGVTGTLEMVIPLGARLGHPKWRVALKDAGVADDVADDVIQRISESYVPWQENSFPGLLGNVVAGRIANRLDLGGTNCVVDAACASSLSAMHLAALELWSGRAEMMITGGIDTFNDIFMYMCFSKTPALSPTGNAKPFSDDGDGTILGEGVGMFVLKRLSDAERDGDRIHAVIRGIGTSSDGAGNAVYAPKKEGQVRCVQNAYELAGVSPATVELIEAHGTGTKVGDATELAGLTEVFQSADKSGRWCAVGSVKSQIGHTKAAAGAAGVLKAILALKHRVLPPTIKIDQPLPALCDETSPLYANTQARPWLPAIDHPRRAGVSAFGFGGSNFHCVLEESKAAPEIDWDDDVLLAAWSADSLAGLSNQLDDWKNLSDRRDIRRRAAQSRGEFRAAHEHRLVLVADAQTCDLSRLIATAQANLQKYADRANWSTPDGISYARGPQSGKLGMLFPGQGSQYVGMQRELGCRFPMLQDVLAEANDVFSTCAPQRQPSRLSDYVYPIPAFSGESREDQESALRDTEIAQPALGAVSLGLLAVLAEFGVRPEVVAGHSYGELTALCASRRFAPAALYRLSMLRGRLMAEAQEVEGGMLAVGAPMSQVEAALKEAAIDLVIANRNSPSQVVLSGRVSELDRAHETLTRRNIRGKRLPVAAAFHSPLVASAGERFRAVLEEVEFSAAELPVFANTHAEEYPDDADAARSLLAGQLAQPVEFVRQIENMYDSGVRIFLEVGPGGVLTGLVGSILSDREHRACAVDSSSGKRSGMLDLALALGQLSVAGYPVDLAAWDPISEEKFSSPKNGSPRMTIPICGANYVKPRTPKPPTRRELSNRESTPAAAVSPVAQPNVQVLEDRKSQVENRGPSSLPPAPQPALSVLMKMHEQTAQLHRQFLEGQETALRTLESLARGGGKGLRIEGRGPGIENLNSSVLQPPSLPPSALALPPSPQEASTPDAPAVDARLLEVVMDVVSEKTGYPSEMLKPEMSLDHDLGIDSIKRVEILSALQERRPDLPAVKPEQLGTLHRLQDVIELLGQTVENQIPSAPQPSSAVPQPLALSSQPSLDPQLSTVVLEVVSEKTGYPAEMLKPEMSLDHDLGIDSIKRVEILSALQERRPDLPAVKPEQLGTLHRLQDVIELLGQPVENQIPSAPQPSSAVPQHLALSSQPSFDPQLSTIVLEVVSEKTGYPAEMLKPEMSLDHDLGIDSIKRVEILSALQERRPDLPAVKPEQLGTLHRLQDVIELLQQTSKERGTRNEEQRTDDSSLSSPPPFALALPPSISLSTTVPQAVPLQTVGRRLSIPPGSSFLIVSDGARLADDIRRRLELLGYRGQQVDWSQAASLALPKSLAGLILMAPEQGLTDAQLWQAVEWVKMCGSGLRSARQPQTALFATISRLDGNFGLRTAAQLTDPLSGALAGLAKTVRHEWPEVSAIAIDLSQDVSAGDQAVSQLVDRLLSDGPIEIGIAAEGWQQVETAEQSSSDAGTPPVNPGDLVVITGGARGVTAACAVAIAKAWRPRLLLIGRTPLTEEAEGLADLRTAAEIKRALLRTCQPGTAPRAIDQQCRQVLANREVQATLRAIREAGAAVDYAACDIRDRAALAACLNEAQRDHGPVRGVIHGAGVLEDRRIEDKTRTQFDNVFETKVAGWRNLLAALDPEELRCAALFSSSTGRFGRTGQVDYAMANEALNKLARQFQTEHPRCRIRSFNWGPWDGGMVTDSLKPLFAQEGIGLIPLQAGAELLVHELEQAGADRPVELVVLAGLEREGAGNAERKTADSSSSSLPPSAFALPPSDPQLSAIVLEVVAEKTGYPAEMLKPEMSLDHDLGIDSIKRVEILSSLQERRPDLPAVKPEQLGTLHRLQDVIELLQPTTKERGTRNEERRTDESSLSSLPPSALALPPSNPATAARPGWERTISLAAHPYLESHVIGGKAVLPTAMILECLAHAALHRNPGLEFVQADNLRILKGVRLGRSDQMALRVMTDKARREQGEFHVHAALVQAEGGHELQHAHAEIVLSPHRPAAPASRLAQKITQNLLSPPVDWYGSQLFHGEKLHGLTAIEALSPQGILVRSKSASAPETWLAEPWRREWLADPLVIDVALQAIIVWTQSLLGLASLPTAIGSYRQFRRSYPAEGVRIAIAAERRQEAVVRADAEILAADGGVIATLSDIEYVLDAQLHEAFRRNRVE